MNPDQHADTVAAIDPPIVWRSGGLSTCGHCYTGFSPEHPAHLAIRHDRGYDYDEFEPWHESCIEHANEVGHAEEADA